tara:strand:- start:1733 stop:2119 length:387 start_codon:yes stop_codon:yes gene_type:complete
MITLGNGVDIIENNRIKKSIKNKKFIKRVFSETEIILANKNYNKTNYYAKRFAAKEAFLKAIGTGLRNGINFKDISIKNNVQGKPFIIINDKIKKIIKKKFKTSKFKIYLSLSDEKKYSIAYVVLNKI